MLKKCCCIFSILTFFNISVYANSKLSTAHFRGNYSGICVEKESGDREFSYPIQLEIQSEIGNELIIKSNSINRLFSDGFYFINSGKINELKYQAKLGCFSDVLQTQLIGRSIIERSSSGFELFCSNSHFLKISSYRKLKYIDHENIKFIYRSSTILSQQRIHCNLKRVSSGPLT
ncbi:MAG: hypothetical protein HOE90_08845 [Bacteriovoracaceae bacterium]|jgi:hypothetical protein|nr:hypothetical protein [Bacteriovoracaceae bacterium]